MEADERLKQSLQIIVDEPQRSNRMDTIETHNSQTYTGISDIIMNQNIQNVKRNAILTYLFRKKESSEVSRLKAYGINKWKNFMRDIEIYSIKGEMKRLLNEVENLKF